MKRHYFINFVLGCAMGSWTYSAQSQYYVAGKIFYGILVIMTIIAFILNTLNIIEEAKKAEEAKKKAEDVEE